MLSAGLLAVAGLSWAVMAGPAGAVTRASAHPHRPAATSTRPHRAATTVAATTKADVGAAPDGGLAMWAWNWSNSADVVRFAEAQGVTAIFAYVAPGFTTPAYVPPGWSVPEWPLITSLVRDADAAGITVYAMGGDPSWVADPSVAVGWADEALGTGLFAGLHLELEPWQVSTWTTNRSASIADFVTCLADVHAVARSYGVPDEVSLPWWLYQYTAPTGAPLDQVAMANADAVTIVTYFGTTTQLQSSAAVEQADAQALGLPFRLAALSDEATPSWLTFYGDTLAQFDAALGRVNSAMAGTTGYLGVAVEDYTGWAAMP